MFLNYSEIFLLGAFSIIFLYFITHYFTNHDQKYNLYFAIGCLIIIIRTITYNLFAVIDTANVYYSTVVRITHLSFIWGPFFYVLLANSLFPKIGNKSIINLFVALSGLLSLFILIVPVAQYPKKFVYDYVIIAFMLYANYIFTIALIKKMEFSLSLFIANLLFIVGVIHDVLQGSNIIPSSFGELHAYAYFIFLYIVSVVHAQKNLIIEQKHLKSQLNFLHAQIRPHFLYNTINTIRAYSKTDGEKSSELLDCLCTYLRGKLKDKDDLFTSLKDEVALVKAYLSIEKARFENRLQVEYDIDETHDILIPCLIIQPIVENAVKHGLSPRLEGGIIKIGIKQVDENIIITVEDNGIGMDTSQMADILDGNQSGIGISNTNERLKRYYNTEIEISSIKDVGTEFKITIPKKRGNIHA